MTVPISSAMNAYSLRIEVGSWLSKLGFRFLSFLPDLIKRIIHKLFNEIFLTANGSFEVIDSYTPEMAQNELKDFSKFLPRLRKLAANIEADKVLYDKELEEKIQATLDRLYALEGELRIKAYAGGISSKPTSPEMINSLNEKSKSAIILALNKK
ncbi:MAG TPA: hypothetical protein VNS58_25785 [Puia sp.]|jgi:hypothetical protein|nr:hypothetical protein [Puia sp.]